MKHVSFILVSFFLLSSVVFANDSSFVFVIDENNNPQFGYKVLETPKDDAFFGKVDALKKWIVLSKSELYINKNGYLYPVKNSIILDKAQGFVLYLIDSSNKKNMNFKLDDIKINRDIKSIIDNKRKLLSKLEALFPPVEKEKKVISIEIIETIEKDLLQIARQYEKTGQLQKAIETYEEFLKDKGFSPEIVSKIAQLHYKSGNFTIAKNYIEKLPKNEENIKKLIGILIIEKNFDEALKILNQGDLQDKKYLHYLKGIIFYLMNKKNEAYRELIELLDIDKSLAESLKDLLR